MKKLSLWLTVLLFTCRLWAQSPQSSGWTITANHIDPNNYYGLTVGNGMMGLVTSPDPLTVKDIVLNGVYDYYGRGRVSNILKGFNFANMTLDVDGRRIGMSDVSNYAQHLDMKKAVFTASFDVGNKVSVTYTLRALRELPSTSLIQLTIKANQDVEVSPSNVIEAPDILRNVHNYYSEISRPHALIPLLTSEGESPTGKHKVAASCSYLFSGIPQPKLIHEDWDHNRHLVRFVQKLKKGQSFTFSVVGSETSTAQYADPRNAAERLSIYAMLAGTDQLIKRHEQQWDDLWKGDIKIVGNEQDQRDVRFSLYNLYSFVRAGSGYSLSPMGLSGLGYNGHVFWDTEIWMYPPLLMLHPEIARSILDYRYNRLDAAMKNARSHGYKGAMFPWESDDTGQEATPVWALSGPYEQHISADIAIAAWNYYRVTHDKAWLREKGYPILKEVADFWVSRVEKGPDGKYNINNVVAADEWAENIDNDAFTNGAAIKALKDAASAAEVLGEKADPLWTEVASNIPILRFEDGTVKEHAQYHGEQIKQADVNLLSYPLQIVTDEATIKKDLHYYEPRIGEGPAMSYSVLALLYARLDDSAKAYELFKKGFVPNKKAPFGVLAESAGGTNPYFATGAGGMLQAMLSGFGGLTITDNGIEQKGGLLPKQWKSLTITGVGTENKTYTVK